jgi:hypothetical protein
MRRPPAGELGVDPPPPHPPAVRVGHGVVLGPLPAPARRASAAMPGCTSARHRARFAGSCWYARRAGRWGVKSCRRSRRPHTHRDRRAPNRRAA